MKNSRAVAAEIVFTVIEQKQSLTQVLATHLSNISAQDKGFIQEMCYGTLRWLPRLEHHLTPLLKQKPKGKDKVAYALLLVGLYQINYLSVPHHAAIHATVDAAAKLTPRLKNLVNAVLRNYLRGLKSDTEPQWKTPEATHAHPRWLIERLKQDYPEHYAQIMTANNAHPPMWIRVNTQQTTRDAYQTRLQEQGIAATPSVDAPDALCLAKPCPVSELLGFEHGECSVQDASAQLAAHYLKPQAGDKVLDVCAAPGGKSLHLLQQCPEIELTAVDLDAKRLERVQENLQRAGVTAQLICGDAMQPNSWCQGQFDKILLDAPCSATGVIRRHPDIKWLKRAQDIDALAAVQAQCLDAIWPYLRVGGTLLYVTCSILPQENTQQIAAFLARTPDARLESIDGMQERQILPNEQQNMDGFYYARVCKMG